MIVMFTSNFGFFHHHFTPKVCSHYCYVAPVFKGTGLVPPCLSIQGWVIP